MDRCTQSLRTAWRWLQLLTVSLLFAGTTAAAATATDSNRTLVMVVGAYHFVSKANLVNMEVDDPLAPARQAQIQELVRRLSAFRPTKVVLERTSGSSDLEQHYQDYLQDRWTLEASENYQIGFRLAKQQGLPRIYLIQVDADLDFDTVEAYAKGHGQTYLLDANHQVAERIVRRLTQIQSKGTVLDVYRYLNSEAAIRLSNSAYTYLCRIGDDDHFVGADLMAGWHQRNLRMFAKLSRLGGPGERILVLYGQGHSYLLRDFIREAPDMKLVEAEPLLR